MAEYNPHIDNRLLHRLQLESQIRQQTQQLHNPNPQSTNLQTAVAQAQQQLNQLQFQQQQFQKQLQQQFINHSTHKLQQIPTQSLLQTFHTNQIHHNASVLNPQIPLPSISTINVNNLNMIPSMYNTHLSNNNQYTYPTSMIQNQQIQECKTENIISNYSNPLASNIPLRNNTNFNKHQSRLQQGDDVINQCHAINNEKKSADDHAHCTDIIDESCHDYFDLSIYNTHFLFKLFNNSKCIQPLTNNASNCFGNYEIDAMHKCIYEWNFLISGDDSIFGQTSVVIGIYGYKKRFCYSRPKYSVSFYKPITNDTVGYGYNIGQYTTKNRLKYIPRRIRRNDTITMTLDLINNCLSYKHNNEYLGVAFDGLYFQNKVNYFYRMAVKFGKCCQHRSIELVSFQVIPFDKNQNIEINHSQFKDSQLELQCNDVKQVPKKPPLPHVNHDSEIQNMDQSDVSGLVDIVADNHEEMCHLELNSVAHPTKPPIHTNCNMLKQSSVDNVVELNIRNKDKIEEFVTKLIVKTLAGNVMRFKVKYGETIISIKMEIAVKSAILPEKQRLIFAAKELNDEYIVSKFGFGDELILHLLIISDEFCDDIEDKEDAKYCEGNIEYVEMNNIQKCQQMEIYKLNKEIGKIKQEFNNTKIKYETVENDLKMHIEELKSKNQEIEFRNVLLVDDKLKLNNYVKHLEKQNNNLVESNKSMEQLINEKEKENECVACMDSQRSHICLPCGHLCLCGDCVKTIRDICPLCQTVCTNIVKVFK